VSIGAGVQRAREWAERSIAQVLEAFRARPRAGIALIALVGVLLLAGGVLASLSGIVEARARDRAAALGFELAVADTDLGFGSVVFQGVTVRPRGGKTALIKAERVALEVSPLKLLDGARAALRKLSIEGAELEVDVAELARRRTESRAKPGESGGKRAAPLPEVELRDVSLRLRDASGVLVHIEGLHARAEGTSWSAELTRLAVGAAPSDAVRVERAKAGGPLGERPLLAHASAEAATLQWSADTVDAGPTTLARLLALRDALRRPAAASTTPSAPAASPALWTPDAKLELRGMRVLTRESDGTSRAMLEGLAVTVEAEETGFRLRGAGKAPGAGDVSWDLHRRGEGRVEGRVALHDVSLGLFAPVLPRLPFHELERTRVHADLALSGQGLASVEAKGELTLTDLSFASEGLARAPVGPLTLVVRGEASWTPARRELVLTRGDVQVGAAAVTLAGTLAWPADGYRVDLDMRMAKSPCQDVLAAIPAGLLDELATMQLDGHIAGQLLVHVDAADLDATKVDFDIDDKCKFVTLPPLLDLMRFEQPFIHQVLEPDGSLFEFETGPGTPAWTPIELVSPFMVQSVIAHEDGRFFTHQGFAEPEIGVALARNLKARAFKFGASTITMQLVKNVFLHRDKLLARKVQEALIVWWLEQQWDKRRILQLYLNVIEYGPAIYGLRNAAWHYFGTIPMNLTPAQSAFLASVLPAPKVFHEHFVKGQLSQSMKNRMATFMKHLHARERIDAEALAFGLEELEQFTFYDPTKPPPPPVMIRGTAQSPPFDAAAVPYDQWDLDMPDVPAEESYGP
jgi:hypothetical protein